jgi:hypothetical protein
LSIVDIVPLWAAGLILFAGLMAGGGIGVLLRRRAPVPAGDDQGYVLSAALGLLALLIGFTFSLALSRYELRRDLVVQEANAIGTTYLRAQLAPEPYRAQIETLMRRYVDARLALADAGEDAGGIARAEAEAGALQQDLWTATVAALPHIQPAPAGALLVTTANDTIDLASTRKAALADRLPGSVIFALVGYAVISAGLLGHATAAGRRPAQVGAAVLFALLALAITLVLDLDRPRLGSIVVSQQPLIDAKAALAPR